MRYPSPLVAQDPSLRHFPRRLFATASQMLLPLAKRLRQKARPLPQAPLTELLDFAAQEKADSRKCVYLVTLPHLRQSHSSDGVKLVAPEVFTK